MHTVFSASVAVQPSFRLSSDPPGSGDRRSSRASEAGDLRGVQVALDRSLQRRRVYSAPDRGKSIGVHTFGRRAGRSHIPSRSAAT